MAYLVSQTDPAESREAILKLWRRNFPVASEARFDWLYQSGQAAACVLRKEDGAPVGAAGLMHRVIQTPCGPVHAGQAIDLNVDRAFRSMGPALSLARRVVQAAVERGYGLVYAFPNDDSELVLRRVGYRELGTFERWIKVLRTSAVIDRIGRPWARMAVSAASPAVDVALAAASREFYHRCPAGMRVEVCEGFDASFDRLWEAASRDFPVIGQRTAAYLTWRFAQSPDARHRVFTLRNSHGVLMAYVVFHCHENTVYVNDFLFADERSLSTLVAAFLRFARCQKAESVVLLHLGTPTVARIMKQYGFWQRPTTWKALIWSNREPTACPAPRDKQCWHMTRADVDTDS